MFISKIANRAITVRRCQDLDHGARVNGKPSFIYAHQCMRGYFECEIKKTVCSSISM